MLPLSKKLAIRHLLRQFEAKRMNYPQAIPIPGPAHKTNGGVNKCRGVVLHSMVGPWSAALGELQKPQRQASWHYSVLQSGEVYAHYPDEAQTWHAGSKFNNFTIGIEHEGGLNPTTEPLTPAQLKASVSLVQWLSKNHGFPLIRRVGLWEHNEVSDLPTACPSDRIPWEFYVQGEEPPKEDDMKPIRVWCAERQKTYLVGPFGAVPVEFPADDKELEKLYGAHAAVFSPAMVDALVAA